MTTPQMTELYPWSRVTDIQNILCSIWMVDDRKVGFLIIQNRNGTWSGRVILKFHKDEILAKGYQMIPTYASPSEVAERLPFFLMDLLAGNAEFIPDPTLSTTEM